MRLLCRQVTRILSSDVILNNFNNITSLTKYHAAMMYAQHQILNLWISLKIFNIQPYIFASLNIDMPAMNFTIIIIYKHTFYLFLYSFRILCLREDIISQIFGKFISLLA